MKLISAAHEIVGNILSICAIAATLELIVSDEKMVLGFKTACSLGISLVVVRSIIRLIS